MAGFVAYHGVVISERQICISLISLFFDFKQAKKNRPVAQPIGRKPACVYIEGVPGDQYTGKAVAGRRPSIGSTGPLSPKNREQ